MKTSDRLLAGRYRLLEPIGEGGMAVVHRAHDELLDRAVAVKVLKPAYASDPEFVDRFHREARHAASLHDPRIVTIHDLGVDEESGADFIVMQLVHGPDLQTLLADDGRLPLGQALRIGVETARALDVAHEHGIVHRDVKPANILVDDHDVVRVADFGIARAAGDGGATTAGVVIGSPHYASPEQVAGEPITPASDIYSLGVVLYELLTGRRPFDGPSPAVIALKRLRETPEPPSAVARKLPPEVDEIVLRAMERDPARRYSSAAEFGVALETFRLRELGGVRRTGSRVRNGLGVVTVGSAADAEAGPEVGDAADAAWTATVVGLQLDETVSLDTTEPEGSPGGPAAGGWQAGGTAGRERRVAPERARLRRPPAAQRDRDRRRPVGALALPFVAFGLLLFGAGWFLTSRAGPPAGSSISPSSAGGIAQASPTVTSVPSLAPSPASTPSPMATDAPGPSLDTTPVVTPRPTLRPTPRPTIAPAPGATAPARDPAETVARFYSLVAAHRFDEAAALWSSRMRREYPPSGNIDGRFAQTTAIDIQALDIRSQSLSGRSAVVYVDLIEYRESSAPRRFRGTWDLVLSSSGWLMDEPHF